MCHFRLQDPPLVGTQQAMPPTKLKDPIGRAASIVAAASDRCDPSSSAAVIGVTGSHLLTSPLVLALVRRLIACLSQLAEQPPPRRDAGAIVIHCLSRPPKVYQRWLKREGGGGGGGAQAIVQYMDHIDQLQQHEEVHNDGNRNPSPALES